jgi:hypothetical protein
MQSPRATSALGPVIARANVTPGRLDKPLLDQSVPAAQAQIDRAARIDREADFQLLLGRHVAAERLSHQALALRAPQFVDLDHAVQLAKEVGVAAFVLGEPRRQRPGGHA